MQLPSLQNTRGSIRGPLSAGSRGPDVNTLQQTLNRAIMPSPNLVVDGIFGIKTQSAVIRFQRSQNLKPDGIVGPRTAAALRLTYTGAPVAPIGPAPAPSGPRNRESPLMPEEPDAFERLAQALMSGVARLGQTLIDVLNPLGLALEVVSELRGKIKAAVQNTLQALSACVRSVRQQAQKSLPLIASALRSALRVLIDGLARCVTFLVNLTGVGGIANKLKQLIDALAKAVNGIVDKIIQTIGGVGGSIVSTAREIERAIGDLPNLVLA